MRNIHGKMPDRQRDLRVWILENGFDLNSLRGSAGVENRTRLAQELFRRETMIPALHAECLRRGIPADLLPPPTRKKSELLAENLELRARLAVYEPNLTERTAPEPQAPQAQAS